MQRHSTVASSKLDFRLNWMGTVVERGLGIKDSTVWKTFLKEDGGRHENQLQNLCDVWEQAGSKRSLAVDPAEEFCPRYPFVAFWTTAQEVEIEEEVLRSSTCIADTVQSEDNDFENPNAPLDLTGDVAKDASPSGLSARGSPIAQTKGDGSDAGQSVTPATSPDGTPTGEEVRESPHSTVDEEIQKITMKKRVFRTFLHMENYRNIPDPVSAEPGDQVVKRLYLIRTTTGRISLPTSLEAAFQEMPIHFQVDFAATPDACSFIHILRELYCPLMKARLQTDYLRYREAEKVEVQQLLELPHGRILVMQECISNTETFLDNLIIIERKPSQMHFSMPEEVKEFLQEEFQNENGSYQHFLEELQKICLSWTKIMENTLASLQTKLLNCETPMDEVAFWNNSRQLLGDMMEGLQSCDITLALQALKNGGCPGLDNFSFHYHELEQFYCQTQEVNRYMNVLRPSFQVCESDQSLAIIRHAVNRIVSTLRIVWSVSKHYSTAERVAPLMNRIANQLADRVTSKVDVIKLLSMDRASRCTNQTKTLEAKLLLEDWKKSYLDMRASGDSTGQVAPWEFDRKRLFERTDYLGSLCNNILEVYSILEEFANTDIPEMGAAFHATEQLCLLRRKVEELPQHVFDLSYNPLELLNGAAWKCTMEHFRREVTMLDTDYLRLLDDGFGHLRGTQAALELLIALERNPCRPAVKSHARSKIKIAAESLIKEIEDIHEKFSHHENVIHVIKNLPPLASTIFWARRLQQYVQPTVTAFRTMALDQKNDPLLSRIEEKFAALTAAISEYVEDKVQAWTVESQSQIKQLLQRPLLLKDTKSPDAVLPYKANFPHELLTISTEARYLEYFGFVVPLKLRLTALQESKYIDRLFMLKMLLSKWTKLTVQPDFALNPEFQEFQKQTERACKISWMSQSVDSFLDQCLVSRPNISLPS